MAKIRGVVGAIDDTYIPIKAFSVDLHLYINRKCFYTSITLQCICDSTIKFIDYFTGYPSSISDIRIFRNSYIYQEFVHHTNYFKENEFIIDDKTYPVNKWCISLYIERGHLARWQTIFNTAHAQTRQIIECSFAIWNISKIKILRYEQSGSNSSNDNSYMHFA